MVALLALTMAVAIVGCSGGTQSTTEAPPATTMPADTSSMMPDTSMMPPDTASSGSGH
jgi:PBP1b-binding outer membrane lipoprotein LpoB